MTEETIESFASFRDEKKDPGFLVAKGGFAGDTDEERRKANQQHVKKLAAAIFMAMSTTGSVTVRSVGQAASFNALKAIDKATHYCRNKGVDLVFQISSEEGNIGPLRKEHHVSNVRAMVFKLAAYKEWTEDNDE